MKQGKNKNRRRSKNRKWGENLWKNEDKNIGRKREMSKKKTQWINKTEKNETLGRRIIKITTWRRQVKKIMKQISPHRKYYLLFSNIQDIVTWISNNNLGNHRGKHMCRNWKLNLRLLWKDNHFIVAYFEYICQTFLRFLTTNIKKNIFRLILKFKKEKQGKTTAMVLNLLCIYS